MTEPVDAGVFFHVMKAENGYTDLREIGGGLYAAISRFAYTHGIIVGEVGDLTGYADRWCYHSHAAAKAALDAWDGTGEPAGWHRHPGSGRRRSEGPDEYDDEGRRVGAAGVIYRRF